MARRIRGSRAASSRRLARHAALVLAAALAGLGAAAPAGAALPPEGVLVPGESLGGIRLGATKAEVRARWGRSFGRCRSCAAETWYFTYEAFTPQGAAVVFDRSSRVERVYTLWQPPGWGTPTRLLLGASEAEVVRRSAAYEREDCGAYDALVRRGRAADSALYLYGSGLWGLGLIRPGASPCV